MKKRLAIITDIHGNIDALNAVLTDINNKEVDEIICLGDLINIGPYSKDCVDKIIDMNIKCVLGNHELYLLRGTDINPAIDENDKKHFNWVKESLSDKEIEYIKTLPLFYEIDVDFDNNIPSHKIILSHYLINDETLIQPFEPDDLRKSIKPWIKYYDPNVSHIVGHLHEEFDINSVDVISGDIIEEINELPNIYVIPSVGCSYDNYASYAILDIDKSIRLERVKVEYDKKGYINKLMAMDFPDKDNVMKDFYGIEL